jgi:MerR family transcriptional regulator, repressor of the yfmOP operon
VKRTPADSAGAVETTPAGVETTPAGVETAADVAPAADVSSSRLLRIQEAAEEVGLTTRSVRYYEELGLLSPAARSEGAYRLYDPSDLERLRFIKGLRDDAGFSLAEIALLLEDEAARRRDRAALKATDDPEERRAILRDSVARLDRQIETLLSKIERLQAMVDETDARRKRLLEKLVSIDAAPAASPEAQPTGRTEVGV